MFSFFHKGILQHTHYAWTLHVLHLMQHISETSIKIFSFHFKYFISKFALIYDFLWKVPDVSLKNFHYKICIDWNGFIHWWTESKISFKIITKIFNKRFALIGVLPFFYEHNSFLMKSFRYLLCTKSFIYLKLSL